MKHGIGLEQDPRHDPHLSHATPSRTSTRRASGSARRVTQGQMDVATAFNDWTRGRRRPRRRSSRKLSRCGDKRPLLRTGAGARRRLMSRSSAIARVSLCAARGRRSTTRHKAWDDLLKKHVRYVQNGNASRVDYAGFAEGPRAAEGRARRLPEGARALSSTAGRSPSSRPSSSTRTTRSRSRRSSRATRTSSRSAISAASSATRGRTSSSRSSASPRTSTTSSTRRCARKACTTIRARHVAVVCASIGCPMLRNEAFTARPARGRSSRTACDASCPTARATATTPQTKKLEISKIFDWYGKGLREGPQGLSPR